MKFLVFSVLLILLTQQICAVERIRFEEIGLQYLNVEKPLLQENGKPAIRAKTYDINLDLPPKQRYKF